MDDLGANGGLAIVQFSIRATPLLVAVIWSLRVFMAACFGFWLWHDARHDIVATSVQRQQAAASRTGIRSRSAIAQFAFFLVALAVVLVAIEAALRGFSASRLIFPPPSEVLGSLPRVLVEQAPALLLTAQQTVIASIVITAIGATAAIVLLSSELLRAAMLPWIAALSRMPMLLLYLPVMIFVGNRLTAVVTAVFAGWAMAAIAWLDRLGPITSSGRKTAPDAWLASLFSVWTGVLPAAFAGVVSVELFSDDGFGNGIAQAFARLDDVTFFNQILLAVLFSGALTFLAKQVGGVGQTYSGASALITPSPDALSATRLLVLLLLLIGWEAIARYIGNNALMPSITELTVRGLIPLSESAIFYSSLLATASAVGIGVLSGAVAAILLVTAIRNFGALRTLIEPPLSALDATPKIALFPIVLLYFGFGAVSTSMIAAITCFASVALAGLQSTAQDHGPRSFVPGLRVGVQSAILTVVLAEIFESAVGVGHLLLQSYNTFRLSEGYALLIIVFALSIAADGIAALVDRPRLRGVVPAQRAAMVPVG